MSFKFLLLDGFPKVTIVDFPVNKANVQSWLAEMTELLMNYQDFVFMYNITDLCEHNHPNKEELKICRQLVAEWFHEQRKLLKTKCRGIILPLQENNDNGATMEIYREEFESYYKIPTEVLYHPQDLPLLAHALIHDCWDAHSMHLHKVPAL